MAAKDIEKYRYKKGQSGNKAGRPPKLPELDTLLAEALAKEVSGGLNAAQKIIAALIRQAQAGNIRAAEVLFNRAYGAPPQRIAKVNEVRIVDESSDSSFDKKQVMIIGGSPIYF